MKIDNTTAKEWVQSDKKLVVGDSNTAFGEHRELDRDVGKLVPSWPPGATKDNSKLIPPYDVILRADAEVIADGNDTATVEIETTAEENREVSLRVSDTEISTYQIGPEDTIYEQITTTTTDETIRVRAVGIGCFKDSATIDVVQ